jgi:hypothetical protein
MHVDFSLPVIAVYSETGEERCSVFVVDAWNRQLLRMFL